MKKISRWLFSLGFNLVNIVVFVFTAGKHTLHEGGFRGRRWVNWNRTVNMRPRRVVFPENEEQVCAVVRTSAHVRVVGGGHSFNTSAVTDDTLISLDRMNQVLDFDAESGVITVQAGIRLRDAQKILHQHSRALPAAGSTDVQSLGGLCATDVHGTGKQHAFLSEQLISLRVVNGRGVAQTLTPADDEFHAVMGGLGALGIVVALTLRTVPLYTLEKSIRILPIADVEKNIEQHLEAHDHMSLYYLGGVHTTQCRMNIWDNSTKPVSPLLTMRKIGFELMDMVFSGFVFGVARFVHELDPVAKLGFWLVKKLMDGHVAVHPATSGFARRLFYHHDEIEYGIPFEKYQACLAEVRAYLLKKKFFCILEIRFAPNRTAGLLSPGAGRKTCYIELAPALSSDPTEIFTEVEKIFWKYGGHVHLGKWTRATAKEIKRMYGERFDRFLRLRHAQDPEGVFVNEFAERVFGPSKLPTLESTTTYSH